MPPILATSATSASSAPSAMPEMELCVVGCFIFSPKDRSEVLDTVGPEMFTDQRLAILFRVAAELYVAEKHLDVVTLKTELDLRGLLDRAGGYDLIARTIDETPVLLAGPAYAEKVRASWKRSQAIRALEEEARTLRENPDDEGSALPHVIDRLARLIEADGKAQTLYPIAELCRLFDPAINKRDLAERGIASCGIPALDKTIEILRPGKLTVLAGRPGIGKTTLARQMALSAAWSGDVLFFSLEEPKEVLRDKLICFLAAVSYDAWRKGMTTAEQEAFLSLKAAELEKYPITVCGMYSLETTHIRLSVKRLHSQGKKTAAVIVDHLQLMKHPKANTRNEAIGETTRLLKLMSLDLDVPIVLLSQMNRSIETRSSDEQRPRLADLRESGDIEANADNVLFLWREREAQPSEVTLTIAKHRDGPTGDKRLALLRDKGRFEMAVSRTPGEGGAS